jgi:hypothetical protein
MILLGSFSLRALRAKVGYQNRPRQSSREILWYPNLAIRTLTLVYEHEMARVGINGACCPLFPIDDRTDVGYCDAA